MKKKRVLITGASGATGRLLVEQLLDSGHEVRAIVRNRSSLPEKLRHHQAIMLKEASLLELSDHEMKELVDGCDAVASCLGHNLSFKGIYGHPRKLVTDATRRLCQAVKANKPNFPVKYVLMNTVGNRNRNLVEPISNTEKIIVGIIRALIPPQVDNEQAAEYLRTEIGQDDHDIEWAAVRPDSLTDESEVTKYKAYPSPIRSAIFNSGKTSRINVAHFMAALMTNNNTWQDWKGQMPVLYNEVVD